MRGGHEYSQSLGELLIVGIKEKESRQREESGLNMASRLNRSVRGKSGEGEESG